MNYDPLVPARNIASFLSIDGEIDTSLLIRKFWIQRKNVFLPVLHPSLSRQLLFVKYTKKTNLILNKFNILEPSLYRNQSIESNKIDIMLVPLVAFDLKGQRLGLGGGFYDRTLKDWKKTSLLPIGLAYDFQLINEIPIEEWDIPLPVIITPSKIWKW
ncbi:5-formyltetrahydrofolate cyclo-ligase [Candidatus Pantoea edessiphila]|uniref:5-formyltetrahydrofolate cyclo-ligase n=1 Tax=Candidatus Pantoea edessiphila TaxID=2044610 RepID=UPI001F545984|nr:5-formyltetrahydrofolate cyclo-ligase [Candidatus Pantoea edessiphila]